MVKNGKKRAFLTYLQTQQTDIYLLNLCFWLTKINDWQYYSFSHNVNSFHDSGGIKKAVRTELLFLWNFIINEKTAWIKLFYFFLKLQNKKFWKVSKGVLWSSIIESRRWNPELKTDISSSSLYCDMFKPLHLTGPCLENVPTDK